MTSYGEPGLQEVSIMKDWIKNYFNGRDTQALLIQYVLVGFIAMIGLVLAYTVLMPCEQANADYLGYSHHDARDAKEATRRAVLHWMEENSRVSQQVLAKIYGTAAKSVNPDLVLAICVVESNFNPRAESDKGAVGLMGIMPGVWLDELKAHGIVNVREDLYAIPNNIASGIYVLERYLAGTKDLKEALRRYSGGDPGYANRVLRAAGKISLVRRSEENILLASAGTDG
jgi:soluble lytic murein transglycosylase-like protein